MTNAVSRQEISGLSSRWQHSPLGRRFQWMMAGVVMVLAPAEVLLARHVQLKGVGLGATVWAVLGLLVAVYWYCRWRPLPRLVEASELTIWAILFTNGLSMLIQIAGRSPRPLMDEQLTRLDKGMHFTTASMVHLAAQAPEVRVALAVLYALVALIILLSIVLLPFLGHGDVSRRYIAGIVFAAILTAGIFALWPAAGPWTTEGFAPSPDQAAVTAYLRVLKSHGPAMLNMKQAAIVAFPSFHVLLAILSAVALSAIRPLRVPVWAMAVLMCVATLTTGWHYLTDVLGGLVLSGVTLLAVEYALPSSQVQYRRFAALSARPAGAQQEPDAVCVAEIAGPGEDG